MMLLLSAALSLLSATVTDIQIREHHRRVNWLATARREMEETSVRIDKRTEEIRQQDEHTKRLIESLRRATRQPGPPE